jgi:hypothetical protein
MAETNVQSTNRVFIASIYLESRQAVYDYPYGQYIANFNYFTEMARIQQSLIDKSSIRLSTGYVVDLAEGETSDYAVLNLHFQYMNSVRNAIDGFSVAMLSIEKKIFTSLQ